MSIVIFSGRVHTGKTTRLIQWSSQQKNVAGLVMPDIEGCRKIMDIKTNVIYEAQCIEPEKTKEILIQIGKFYFYKSAFDRANKLLTDAFKQKPSWLIIDEIGKLELQEQGFYPSVKKIIVDFQSSSENNKLLLVVRDSMVEEVVSFFKIIEYTVIEQLH